MNCCGCCAGVPSPSDRKGILQVLLHDMRHTLKPFDVAELAAATHGFVGADLSELCNEAAMSALRRCVELKKNAQLPVAVLERTLSGLRINSDSTELSREPMLFSSPHGHSLGQAVIAEGDIHSCFMIIVWVDSCWPFQI